MKDGMHTRGPTVYRKIPDIGADRFEQTLTVQTQMSTLFAIKSLLHWNN